MLHAPRVSRPPRPFPVARAIWRILPAQTRAHARAAATEAAAAVRSFADGGSDGVETAIDRVSRLLGGRSR